MTDTGVVERQVNPIVELRTQLENMELQFKNALPAHIPVERFMRVVLTAIQNNPDLLKADRKSLWNAAMKAAQDGLLPDGREGAMVVRKTGGGGLSITWQPMIAGIRKKARNSGEIATWDAHIVCAGDHFQFQLGDNPQINHSYGLQTDRGPIIGAYSVCVLKDATKTYEVMSIAEIHAIRDRSDAWRAFKGGRIKSTPWSTDEGEMWRKTVARRHSKVIPMSSDLDDLIRRDDELYDFNAPKIEAQADGRQSLSGKLDILAALPSSASPSIGEHVDAETGEITQINSDAANPPTPTAATEAGAAPSAPATSSTPPDPPSGVAPGQAVADPPSKAAAVAPKESAFTSLPKTEKEYFEATASWINTLDDADEGEARWKGEKNLRNKANVGAESREELQERLAQKCKEIRDADRN